MFDMRVKLMYNRSSSKDPLITTTTTNNILYLRSLCSLSAKASWFSLRFHINCNIVKNTLTILSLCFLIDVMISKKLHPPSAKHVLFWNIVYAHSPSLQRSRNEQRFLVTTRYDGYEVTWQKGFWKLFLDKESL